MPDASATPSEPYLSDPDVTLYAGDALAVLRELPSESVHCIATSPPFYALRCACGCGGTVQSPDAKGRPRRFLRGHNLRVDHPKDRPGYVNPMRGKRHTPEMRALLSAKASRPKPWIRGERNGMAGRTGASNPNWRGGVSPERQRLYASAEWKRVAREVRVRDGGCVECGSAHDTHIHHIKSFAEYPELRLDAANLVTLCRDCHHDAHRREVTP